MLPLAAHPFAHCSRTRIRSLVAFALRSKLPKPEYRPPKVASTSSRFDRGADHVACATRNGRPKTPTASGETRGGSMPAAVAPVQVRQSVCSSQKTPTLVRRVICHVTRALAFSNKRSEYARRLESGAYNHFAGSPALRLSYTLVLRVVLPPRCATTKYHARSRAIRPPIVPEMSYTLVSGLAATPWFFRASVRLSDSSFSPVPLTKRLPCVELPPVFGTRFTTSPPVSV